MRTRTRAGVGIVAIATSAAVACNALAPSGFWKNYRHDLIAGQSSDQGPWGGHRWIQWTSQRSGAFTVADATRFAESHGWKHVGTKHYSAEEISSWVNNKAPVFPLIYENQGMTSNSYCTRFPRTIDGPATVVRFDSMWTRVPPGSGNDEVAFGFVLVSDDGRQMAVYHAWGDI